MKNNEKDWMIGRIFWGLLFMLIGGLILAENFEVVDVNWSDLWRLWPLTVIGAGLSILSLQKVVWRVLAAIFALGTLVAIACVALSGSLNMNNPAFCREIQIDKDGVRLFVSE